MSHDFIQAMAKEGINCSEAIIADGEIHRFDNGGKGRNGWYALTEHGGVYGDWRLGITSKWKPAYMDNLSEDAKRLIKQKTKEAQELRHQEVMLRQEEVAQEVLNRWNTLSCEGGSYYLQNKGVKAFDIRFEGDILVVPLRDEKGKLWNVQHIYPNGNKQFMKGGRKKGLFHTIGRIETTAKTVKGQVLYICEGYATAASVHMATKAPVLVCFDVGNLESVAAYVKTHLSHFQCVIAGDNDRWQEAGRNIGKIKAEEIAKKYGFLAATPEFSAIYNYLKPTDWNDMAKLAGLDEVCWQLFKVFKPEIQEQAEEKLEIEPEEKIEEVEKEEESEESRVDAGMVGFVLTKKGLHYEKNDEKELEWICSFIHVLSYTRDENSENWGRLVRFQDLDGYTHEHAIPMELLSGDCTELYALLLSLGLRITTKKTARNKLTEYLQGVRLEKRAVCTSRIGWYGDHFILPEGAVPPTDEVYLQSDAGNFIGFRTSGTLQEWQEHIAIPSQGNTRLVFALSCAFAAPLLPLVHAESGGFNLKGTSSIGKSTALAVAASVWGGHKYIQQWKATGNALEAVAETHNHALLCLDELGQVDGREAGEIAYMLANGSGKNRLKAKGGLRKKFEWNLLFLSTGEISIADKLHEAGKKAQAGMLARLSDIPADAGKGYRLFDTVHGFKDGHHLAYHLKDSVCRYYGTAIRSFLPHLAGIKDQLPEVIKQIQDDFFTRYVANESDGQVQRVATRFVLVAAAGELAIKLGILPYDRGEAFTSAGECFKAWLEARGNDGAYEVEEAIRQVQAFFELHHSSRFALMGEGNEYSKEEKIINQAGYKRKLPDGSYEFFVYPEIFRKEICRGFDVRMVCEELERQGFLLRGHERHFVKLQRLPIGRKKVYHFTNSILTEGNV